MNKSANVYAMRGRQLTNDAGIPRASERGEASPRFFYVDTNFKGRNDRCKNAEKWDF